MSADGQLEASLEAFEKAWQAGQAPAIADFLARAPLELRPALLEELVKIDLECRWRRIGECAADLPAQPRLEDYLQRFPELAADVPVTLIGQEYRVRQWWGDAPAHFEFAARFPQHAERLNDALRRIDDQLDEESARQTRSWSTTVLPAEPVLDASSVAGLVEAVHALPLLRPTELAELAEVQTQFKDAHGLAREMLQRDWLTAFQVNQLLQGRGFDLVVGPYILLERLGEGGTGWVFKARHQHMNRLVALKVLRRELLADAEVLGRFYREIQVVSQLSHAHVVHAYDAGPLGRMHALVMEYAPGVTLSQLVKKNGPLPIEQATEYICQAARGLQHIHERGLIHRDVKPSNLLVTWERSGVSHESPASLWGTVKVLDLGLSRLGKVSHGRVCGTQSADGSSAQLTPQGAIVVGTPDYLAPEQAADFHGADIRADIYSLGCTWHYLLTGQAPFPGGTLAQKLMRHQFAEPPAIQERRPDMPDALVPVLRRMLAKEPADRFAAPAQVVAALQPNLGPLVELESIEELAPLPRRRQRSQRLLAAAALSLGMALFAASVFFTWRWNSGPPTVAQRPTTAPPRYVAAPPPSASAFPTAIPTLYATGIGEDGLLLPDGAPDPHWTITATPAGSAAFAPFATNPGYPVGTAWLANSATSRWISPQADEKRGDAAGSWTYRTSFDLTGYDAATARISALVAADNHVTEIRLNGISLNVSVKGFAAFTPLPITQGFTTGVNHLEFVVLNDPPTVSPSGLRVELTGVAVAEDGNVSPIIAAGFERPNLQPGQFLYTPPGAWKFGAGAGITANGSGFTRGNPPAPEGAQAAFLQFEGSMTQMVRLTEGKYVLTFQAAQRANIASQQDFEVWVNRRLVGTFTPVGTAYQNFTTERFQVPTGTFPIVWQGKNTRGGDNTAFIDAIQLLPVTGP